MRRVSKLVLFILILVSFGCASDTKPTVKADPYAQFGGLLEKLRSTQVVFRNGTKIFGKGTLNHLMLNSLLGKVLGKTTQDYTFRTPHRISQFLPTECWLPFVPQLVAHYQKVAGFHS